MTELPPDPEHDGAALLDGRIQLNAGLLKRLRKTHGMSQEALAELCFNKQLSVSIASIKRAESGKPVLYRTARHLALVFQVDVAALTDASGQPLSLPAAGLLPDSVAPRAAGGVRSGTIRYVLELRVALEPQAGAALADASASTDLLRRFGGVRAGQDGTYLWIHFGLPQAYRSDIERGLACAIALRRTRMVRPGQAIVLRLIRLDGEAGGLDASPMPCGKDDVAIHVARKLVRQLVSHAEFSPRASGQAYQEFRQMRRPDAGMPYGLSGRGIEVQQFKSIIDLTHECQSSHIVYLRGMAGVGKTRLLTEFGDLARQSEFACHRADVLDFGMENWFAPLGQLVRGLLELDRHGASSLQAMFHHALEHRSLPAECGIFLPLLAGVVPQAAPMALYAAMSSQARAQGMLMALRALLLRQALRQPLLICIEDVQWGDAKLFAILGDLLACTDEAAIVWVLTSRNEGDPLEQALRPRFANPLTLFDLGPMRLREANELAEQFDDVSPAYRVDCVERAQGNPLYLTQLLSDPEHSLPGSLMHLIQSRLDRLPAEQQQALRLAAVMGNRFDLERLREALELAHYLPERGSCPGLIREYEPGQYAFVHDLVMHCIYDAIAPEPRAQLHRRVAQVFRQRQPMLYAQHLLRANDPAAFDALLLAMREQLRLFQYDSAAELAQQCEAFPARADGSFTLALLRAKAQAGLGQTATARLSFQLAMQLAREPADKISVALALAPVLNTLNQLDEEERLLEQTMPLAREAGAEQALARLLYLHGNVYFPRGDYARSRGLHEQALHFARSSGDIETGARAISGIGDAHYAEGRMRSACDVFDQVVRICEEKGLAAVEASNRSARGSAWMYLGEPSLALRDAFDAVRCSRKVGDRRAEIFSRLTASWVLIGGARHAEAGEELSTAIELVRSLGAARFEAMLLEGMARVAFQQGRQTDAERYIVQAAELVESQQLQSFIGPWIYASMALIADDQGLRRQALRKGREQLAQGGLAHNVFRYHVSAAEICLLDGDAAQAYAHAGEMEIYARQEPCSWVTLHTGLIRSAGAWLQRPGSVSQRALQQSLQQSVQAGFAATMPRLRRLAEEAGF